MPAIHLVTVSTNLELELEPRGIVDELLHDLQIDLLHVHLLIEFDRELRGLQQLCIYAGRHLEGGSVECRGWGFERTGDGVSKVEVQRGSG